VTDGSATPVEHRVRRAAAAVVCGLLAVTTASCTGDEPATAPPVSHSPSPSPTEGSTSTLAPKPAPARVRVTRVSGHLAPKDRAVLERKVGRVVSTYFDDAFLGGSYPRSAFGDAFDTFSAGATRLARRDKALLTNSTLGPTTESVVARRQTAYLSVLAPHKVAAGVTALVNLRYLAERGDRPGGKVAALDRRERARRVRDAGFGERTAGARDGEQATDSELLLHHERDDGGALRRAGCGEGAAGGRRGRGARGAAAGGRRGHAIRTVAVRPLGQRDRGEHADAQRGRLAVARGAHVNVGLVQRERFFRRRRSAAGEVYRANRDDAGDGAARAPDGDPLSLDLLVEERRHRARGRGRAAKGEIAVGADASDHEPGLVERTGGEAARRARAAHEDDVARAIASGSRQELEQRVGHRPLEAGDGGHAGEPRGEAGGAGILRPRRRGGEKGDEGERRGMGHRRPPSGGGTKRSSGHALGRLLLREWHRGIEIVDVDGGAPAVG